MDHQDREPRTGTQLVELHVTGLDSEELELLDHLLTDAGVVHHLDEGGMRVAAEQLADAEELASILAGAAPPSDELGEDELVTDVEHLAAEPAAQVGVPVTSEERATGTSRVTEAATAAAGAATGRRPGLWARLVAALHR